MLEFSRQLSFGGMVRYATWRLRGRRGRVTLRLKSGGRFHLCSRDYGVA